MKTFFFGACHLTITFYEEKEIYREKNKTLQATDFSLNLSTDIFLNISKQKKAKSSPNPPSLQKKKH